MASNIVQPEAKNPPQRQRGLLALYAALLGGIFCLLFHNLDGRMLWGDEAETATLARNVTRFGLPRTFDGLNRITLYGAGNDATRSDVWVWSPWLQEYVAAAGFWILGPTTWAGRAPFALIAWLSLGLFAWVVHRLYRDHWVTLAALVLLGTSEVFLLHARQCRYYSISVCAQVLFIFAVYQLLAEKRAGIWTLAGALILQFYSNYIMVLLNAPVLLGLAGLLFRQNKASVRRLGFAVALLFIAAAPWLIYAQIWRTQAHKLGQADLREKVSYYLGEFQFHFMPWPFVLLPVAGFLSARWSQRRRPASRAAEPDDQAAATEPHREPSNARGQQVHEHLKVRTPGRGSRASAVCVGPHDPSHKPGSEPTASQLRSFEWLLFLSLPVYLAMLFIPPGQFMRYMLPTLPVVILLTSAWVFRYVRWRSLAVTFVLLQCLTNLPALVSAYPWRGAHTFRWPLFRYAAGMAHPYTNRLADVVAFLNQQGQPGQTVFVFDPEFPLQFYTPFKIVDARLINGLITNPLPDWLLSQSVSGLVPQHPLELPEQLQPYYETLTIPVHDSFRRGSMPEPDLFEYDTAPTSPYVLYKKRAGAP